jgi:hypothetical protein
MSSELKYYLELCKAYDVFRYICFDVVGALEDTKKALGSGLDNYDFKTEHLANSSKKIASAIDAITKLHELLTDTNSSNNTELIDACKTIFVILNVSNNSINDARNAFKTVDNFYIASYGNAYNLCSNIVCFTESANNICFNIFCSTTVKKFNVRSSCYFVDPNSVLDLESKNNIDHGDHEIVLFLAESL